MSSEVTLTPGEVMYHLHHRQPLTKHDLSRLTGEPEGKTTRHLASLYENGFLVRRRSPQPTKRGKNPYEYKIRDEPGWHTAPDDEDEGDD